MRAVVITLSGTTAVMGGAMMATYFLSHLHESGGSMERYFRSQAGTYAGLLAALGGVLILPALRRGPKLFGMCNPAGSDWLVVFPGALLGGLMGGACIF